MSNRTCRAYIIVLLGCLSIRFGIASREDIIFTDKSWKEYIAKDHDPAWTNGTDELTSQGFDMIPFSGGKMNTPLRAPVPGPLGNVTLQLFPPLYKENFYALYHQPTFWPYCESLERCIVYSQNENADAKVPLVITLPPGIGALDFYIDLAIDCVNTTNITVPCDVSVATWPLPLVITKNVSSICASAEVGQYFGFYDHAGGSIQQLSVTCQGDYSRVIGLIRMGKQKEDHLKRRAADQMYLSSI
ncbi:g10899 [Coccomyxa elongata]